MNSEIEQLYEISKKNERIIIGLMSGTSLDGLDIALCKIQGNGPQTKLKILHFDTLPYEDEFRTHIRKVFAKTSINQQDLCGLNPHIGITHAKLINEALRNWGINSSQVDLIASHGQTVFHAPQILTKNNQFPNSTLQIGDADHIARHTGIITLSDFRQKHLAAGGEGAPLAAYGDYLLFTDTIENRVLLNIGGISNFTFLPKKSSTQQAFASDLGPGNTLMNQYMHKYMSKEMDQDAAFAKLGNVNEKLLSYLLQEDFLKIAFPKTTGPELFNLNYLEEKQHKSDTKMLYHQDVMATLNMFSAKAIVQGIKEVTKGLHDVVLYVSGGGLHNPLLLQNIKNNIQNVSVKSMDVLEMNPDAKEACLFAVLANETVAGRPEHVSGLKNAPAVCMGKISLPH